MNEVKSILHVISRVFTNTVFIISMYYLCISFFGIIRKKDGKEFKPEKTFALVVAAHDEEAVISDMVVSLNKLDYPDDMYDIFVIADNCSDNTAKKAREKGAKVYERINKEKKGKGYALEWMFSKLFKMDKKYDAVVIFDADNLASKNFLKEMNKKLCEGYKVVQGYLDSKNPRDSWITGSYSIAFWSTDRMFQLSRSNLGLSNQLGGTGCCFETEILKKLGWGATCLTEDLEFTCKLVLNGYKVGWAHDAVIYDEKPLTLVQSWHQRIRWMQGFSDVASRYFFKLLKSSIVNKSFTAFDCAIYSINPFMTILFSISMILGFIDTSVATIHNMPSMFNTARIFEITPLKVFLFIAAVFQYAYTPFLLALDKKLDVRMIWYYVIIYPIYLITWLPITIIGILKKNNKDWNHTKHTRSVDISDLEKAN